MANLLSQTEIDTLMGAISRGEVPVRGKRRQPLKMGAVPAKDIKSYDFRHPVLFLKDQLRALQAIHEDLGRGLSSSLSSYLRMATQVKCMRVDQISYDEFTKSLPDTCTVIKYKLTPSDARIVMAVQPTIATGALDKITGGPGLADTVTRPFTEMELVAIESFLNVLTAGLAPAWDRALKLVFMVESLENSIEFCQVARKEEMVAAVTLEVSFGDTQGMINLCYPFRALQGFIDKLSARDWAHEEQKSAIAASKGNMESVIGGIPLRISARLGTAHIAMQDLLQIKRGDVLVLDRTLDQPIDLDIGGRTRFTGHLGTHRGKKAVLIETRNG